MHFHCLLCAVCIALQFAAAPAMAQSRQPGILTKDYVVMSDARKWGIVVGTSHMLTHWMRLNEEVERNCFYGQASYSMLQAAVDDYIATTPESLNARFSETMINAIWQTCSEPLTTYSVPTGE